MLPFLLPDRLQTERLTLRPLRGEDAPILYSQYTNDAEVARYLPWGRHSAPSQTVTMIHYAAELAEQRTAYLLAITLADSPEVPIGLLNLGDSEEGVSVGFGLVRHQWGKGYGRELVAYLKSWLLEQTGVTQVWAYCDDENEASARVLIQAGLQLKDKIQGYAVHPNLSSEPRDCTLFAAHRDTGV
ncbi:GNAT family N-acetyltransferase [Pseudomonas sp. MWU12-2345]|uniref:GNAT family N-acetyltransferase n=1 Tax=Pseudomonas sp. MWU12-2345 TaxID=2928689 RepID=UPI00200C4486|nr:GNAT family N-acetyltransferase [Pseudomonas sp. MWU12-2345]